MIVRGYNAFVLEFSDHPLIKKLIRDAERHDLSTVMRYQYILEELAFAYRKLEERCACPLLENTHD